MTTQGDAEQAVERLGRARRAFVTCHRSPDGDAIGSALALCELAAALGVDSAVVNRDPTPPPLQQLPGAAQILVSEQLPEDFASRFDLVVTVECPDLDRPGFPGLEQLPILNIDHHPSNQGYGESNFLDPEAPAVGELVWLMFHAAGITPTAEAATNCFVALSTDTGDFRYSNATARAFRAAAEMVSGGAEPALVAGWIHDSRPLPSVRLLAEALATLELHCGGRLATLWVDPPAFRRAGADSSHTEDIINTPRSIAGVEVVAFLKQWEPGRVRISLRSVGHLDVGSIAASFGGGGHSNAAGCTMSMEMEAARAAILPGLSELLESAG